MKQARFSLRPPYLPVAAVLLALLAIMTAVAVAQQPAPASPPPPDTITQSDGSSELYCRYGVNALEDPTLTDLPGMGIGWYMNFRAQNNPPRPQGMEYMPTIRFDPANTTKGYTYKPSGAELTAVIAANPDAKWIISNEPDSTSPDQDRLTPERYARGYNELYHLIKGEDPDAMILAGSIVQPTPLRLEYLDRVLVSYYEQFGESMPVDGWSIHNYILREANCDYFPASCWGAQIPTGMDDPNGELLDFRDHDRLDLFTERIVRFRQWLADRGYRGQPVYLTEYGILFTPTYTDEDGEEFSIARVEEYMTATFDYLSSATDNSLGDPNDGYRLVQQWSWFSSTETFFGGFMFLPVPGPPLTYTRTAIGDHYAEYITNSVTAEIDFYPSQISGYAATDPGVPVDVTVSTTIANSGNLVAPATATVRFYDGDPQNGGTQIGGDQNVELGGCGDNQIVTTTWPNRSPGPHTLYVQVIPGSGVTDLDSSNNIDSHPIVVTTESLWLPIVSRNLPNIDN